jgi:uncharacterized protein (DUF302 family)
MLVEGYTRILILRTGGGVVVVVVVEHKELNLKSQQEKQNFEDKLQNAYC